MTLLENEKLIGDRLKKLRNKIKKNQEMVADDIGISRARYSHYENNHVEPDIELINKLAEYYNVTTDYLLGRTNEKNIPVEDMSDEEIDQELEELLSEMKVWYKEEPEDKQLKLRMLRKIMESFEE